MKTDGKIQKSSKKPATTKPSSPVASCQPVATPPAAAWLPRSARGVPWVRHGRCRCGSCASDQSVLVFLGWRGCWDDFEVGRKEQCHKAKTTSADLAEFSSVSIHDPVLSKEIFHEFFRLPSVFYGTSFCQMRPPQTRWSASTFMSQRWTPRDAASKLSVQTATIRAFPVEKWPPSMPRGRNTWWRPSSPEKEALGVQVI